MWTSFLSIPPLAIGFLLSLHLVISRPLEGTDNVSDMKNLPEDRNVAQRSRGVNSAVTTIGDKNSPANSGPPGCCTPELYFGFDNAATDRGELEGRRAQFPEVSSKKGPCVNYADLNTGHLQFKSANLATATNAITIAVWVKLRSRLGIQPILVLEGEAGALRFELFEGFVTWRYSTTRPSLASFALLSDIPVVPENIWTHLLVQYDAHSRRCAVFLNGEKILNGLSREGPLEIAWGELTSIGKFSIDEELALKLDGSIDEFYIYYCSLPEIVIRRLVQECHVDGKCSPLGPVVDEPCDVSTFQCKNGKCARQEWRCDGENDCGDWSDEMGCDEFCGPGEQSSASQGQCVYCYCSERSKNCSRANVYRDRLIPKLKTSPRDPPMYLVDITGGEVSGVKYTADHRNKEFVAYNVSKGSQFYWALPRELLGNKLTSYGGKLRYSLKYSEEDNPGSLSRHARIVRDIPSFVDLEREYFIDGNGGEDANGGSGLTTLDTTGPAQVIKISTTGKVTSDGEEDTTTAEFPSSYSAQSAVFQTLTAITELVSTETDPLTQTQHGTSTSLSSTAYTTDRPTKELLQSTAIPDKVSMITESSTTGGVETISTRPDPPYSVTAASSAIVSSSVYRAGSPTAGASTTIPETPPITTGASTESQEETRTAYSFSSTAAHASTDEQDKISTADTSTSRQVSYTYAQYETTTFVPHQAKSTEKSTTVPYTAISDGSSIATAASAEDQGKTTTTLPSSTYSIDKTTTEAPTAIPELFSPDTDAIEETTAATFSSAYTTDTADTPTTICLMSSWDTHPSTAHQDDTARAVSSSSFSTVITTEEPTTTQDTSSTVTDTPAASVSTYETFSNKEDTTEVNTISRAISEISTAGTSTLAEGDEEMTTVVSTSTYSAVTTPTDEITTIPETSTTAADVWTEEDDEATTQLAPFTVYDTLIPDEKTQTTYQRTTSTTEGVLNDSQQQTSASYSTNRPSSTSVASILNTSSTINIAFTEVQHETASAALTVIPETTEGVLNDSQQQTSASYSTNRPSSTSVASILNTSPTINIAFTEVQHETASAALTVIPETSSTVREALTEAQYETLPTSASGTDLTVAVTTISRTATFSPKDTSSEGEHEISTAETFTHRGTDSYTIEASTIIRGTSSTVADALTEEETVAVAPSSTFSTDDTGMEETTTIPVQSSTVVGVASAPDTTPATPSSVYSTDRQTTEVPITDILDTSSVATDVSDDEQYESTTVVSSSVDSDVRAAAGETTTFVFPSSYSTEKVSLDETTEENTTTLSPSSTYRTDEAGIEETTTIPFQASTLANVASAPEDTTTAPGEKGTFPWSYSTDETTAIPDTSSTLVFASMGVPSETTGIPSLALSTEGQTTKVYTEIPDTTSKETRASTEFIDETSTAVPPSADSIVRATTVEPSNSITETYSTEVDLSTEEQDETTTGYSTEEPTPETSLTPITETSPTSEDETASFLSSPAPSSRNATSDAVAIPVTKTVTDSSTVRQDEATTIEPSFAHSNDRQTTETSTEIPDTSNTATDLSTESGEATTVVSSLPYNTDRPTAEETTRPSDTSSMVKDTTTLVQDDATTTGTPGTPADVTGVSALKISTVVSLSTNRPGIQTTEESAVLQTTSSATYISTTVVPSPSYSADSPTIADTTVTPDKSSTITDVNIVRQKTTTVESRTSEGVTSSSAPTTSTSPSSIAEAVRLVGRNTTLIFHHDLQPSSGSIQTTVQIPLTEGKWRLADGARISRDTFLRVLSDVQDIFVRASYNGDGSGPKTLSIRDLSLDVASEQDSGFGKASLVEQCECPVGYSGLSCESCKPGYYRSRAGEMSAACIKCDCHSHSEDGCDPETGQCKNCKHNTDGIRCEKCLSGFYGNATIGKPSDCKACPCPATSPPGRVSPTCFLAEDGQPTCDACPPGYGGRRCQKCVKPYEGDPTTPGGKCKLTASISEFIVPTTKKLFPEIDCGCDVRGSVNISCDPLTRQCYCKKHVEGRTCEKCKKSFFNLQSDEPDGCVACFCFGLSKDCKCADYYKDIIRITFVLIEGPEFLRLSNLARQTIVTNGFQVQGDPQHFVYDKFDKLATGTYYWFLGEEFRGDMISSYDGIMRYTVSHEMNPGGELTSETDVQITGRGLVLRYRHGRRLEGGKKGMYGLMLSETWLKFPDGGRVTRDNVMTALSAVDSILIRATYSTTTTQASLYDVTLEKGVPQATRFGKAKNIEQCSCPPEYIGTSCQHCAHGYTRSYSGPNFSPCVSCPCNQHSKECDPENGQCVRCDHNTTGPQCDKCSVGFYGDPMKGTPKDCLPCPCPLTIASNQFSRICKLESDGNPTCTACQIGYTGRNCERCARGYAGNPSNLGEKCIKIPADFLPTVRVRPMKRIREEGGNAQFYCFAGGQPKPGFSWSRKDKQPMSRRVFIKGKRLLIRGVKKEDEGTYLCTARNVYGSGISSGQLTVKVRLEDPIVVSVSPKVLHVPLNQSAQFTCKAKSVTDYRLKWTRGMYGRLPEGAANVNGVLSIEKTQMFHGGTYTCTGKNAFSDDMATVQLRVGGVTSPQVFISPTRLSVLEGESAQFRCSATGFPAPVLQWHGGPGGRLPPEAKITNGNGILTFVKVEEIQEGEYFCTASNEGGISSTSTFLNVSAAGSVPVISVSPRSLTISEGQEALFQCTADGDPAPIIRWSRENGPFPESSTLENGMFRIFPTRPEDGGAYVCTAANSFGARAFLVNLRIERDTSVPPTALVAPAKQTVDEGLSTFLSCQVTGDPYPSIQWSKVGGPLTDNHVIEGGLLRIKEVTKDDEGMYVCVAQNKKGVEQATGILNVRKKVMPKIVIMPARKLTVTGGETVVFKCVVKAGNPPPALVWEREENEPLNSSNDGILVISRVSGDSQGKYICKATNALGSTEAVALLIVQGEPKVIVSPSSPVSVIAGSSVTLECAAVGDPSPAVQWIAPEDSRSSPQLIEGEHGVFKLVIEDASPKDQGNYTCQAENLLGITRKSLELLVTVAHEAPEVLVEPGSQTVILGNNVEFQCNASGIPTPSLIWERPGSNLPEGAADRNGLLILTSVSPENSGTYVCKAVNSEGADSINVQLKVIVPPRIDVTPSQISVREGNSFSLYCVVSPSLPVAWSKVNGSIPHGSENAMGTLSVSKVEVEHAGKYRCYASNAAGFSESFASVTVFAAPKVMAWPESLVATPNSSVSFQCNATGIPDPMITWTKEGGDLPKRHSIVHGVLTLVRLISFDDGRYICTAANAAGVTGASVKLTVEDLPHVTIRGGTSVKTVPVGGNLTLECIGTGSPQPRIRWSRIDGPLSEGLVIEGGFLIVQNARLSYGGAYKCEVTNRVGSVQSRVAVFVQESPKVIVMPLKSRVKIGEPAEFTCLAGGSPSPDLSWRKLNGSLPAGSTMQGGVLRIANVTENGPGTYVCDATNVEGSANGSAVLEIKVTVPHFTQKPLSYLRFPTLTREPLHFAIEVVFTPEMADGLILYNDQLNNGSVGDFISFGMSDGFAEFRFNLGFEPAIIRSQQPLRRHEWHTVILSRDAKEGNLTVDGKPAVTGISKGSNTGLNLNQDLYVGGVPDFSSISSLAGFISGFIGCLSYLTINGKVVNLGHPVNHVGLDDCEVCQTKPCKNGGTCTEVTRDWGFVCSCRQGYSGRTCHNSSQRCSPGVCNEGRCENIGDDDFRCICPAGYSGKRCEQGTPIDTPMFEGDSFMSFPGIEGAVSQLKFSINFMVLKSEQKMLVFYNGQKPYPARGDFISLVINHGRVEFKFNLGSGPGVVYSTKNVSLGIWHTVVVERKRDEASMKLDNEPAVKAYSPCCSIGLNLELDLFIGGLDNFTTVDTDRLGVSSGLFGCISSVSIDDREINLLKSNMNQRDIKDCAECLLPCEIKPCLNNASCIPVGKTGFFCSCAQGYTGQKCEFALNEPGKNKTCLNGGVEFLSLNRICTCPIGYEGQRCKTSIKIGDSASFSGDGYLEFPASAMRGPRVTKPDYMSLDIKSKAGDGLILWQGQKRDHFAIGLREGFLEFRFELGSGPAVLLSRVPVNDGQWHSVEVFRSFDKGFLKVDNKADVNGTSAAGSKGLNLHEDANIFIGGGNNVPDLTRYKFDTGFTGCIKNVHFKSRKMSFQRDALRGWNVLPCDR